MGVAFALTAVIIAGCGSSSSSSSSSSSTVPAAATSTPASSSGGSLQAKAEAFVAQHTQLPPASAYPGLNSPAFKPGHGTAAAIACGFAAPACAQVAGWAVQALHAMGWTAAPAEDGQLSPLTWSSLINRAAQQHLNGLVLIGVDVNEVKAAVTNAVAAGVHFACVVCNSGPQWQGKVYDVTPDWAEAGVYAAWQIMAHSGDKAKVVEFTDPQFAAPRLRGGAAESTVKANCPTCTFINVDAPTAALTSPGPPQWVAYLAAHPPGSITDAIGEYDSASLVLARTDKSDGRSDIWVGGYDGDLPALQAIVSGNPPMNWSIAHPYYYEAWAAADVLGRWKAGLAIPKGESAQPIMIVNKTNAPGLLKGNPVGSGSSYPAPPGDWQGAFKKLWGTS